MTPLFRMSSLWILLDAVASTQQLRLPDNLICVPLYQHHASTAIINNLSQRQLLKSLW